MPLLRRPGLSRARTSSASSARFNADAEPFRKAATDVAERAHDPDRLPGPRRGRGRDDRAARGRARSSTSSCGSSSRRASSRRCCAGASFTRGARHHRADLRHLPGRLPDERGATRSRTLCGVEVPEPIRLLRRLLYCGEWIESHALHVYMLHAPDFLGYAGAVELARDAPGAVERGLALKKTGNAADGARRRPRDPPDQRAGRRLLPRADARGSCARSSSRSSGRARRRSRPCAGPPGSSSPSVERRVRARRAVASRASTRSSEGGSCSDRGARHRAGRVRRALRGGARRALERAALAAARARHVPRAGRSRASRSTSTGSRRSRCEAAREAGLEAPCRDPFRSIVVRSVELVYACDEALRLIEAYEEPDAPSVAVEPRRGHRLRRERGAARAALPPLPLDAEGTILDAKIVPPTSQNQRAIEDDLRDVVGAQRAARRRGARATSASRRSATTTRASPARRTS